jgi:hypothetical protein
MDALEYGGMAALEPKVLGYWKEANMLSRFTPSQPTSSSNSLKWLPSSSLGQ